MCRRVVIRPEVPSDFETVGRLNDAAFGQPSEGALIRILREEAYPAVSLVAVVEETIVGHILFTPVVAEEAPARLALLMGLALSSYLAILNTTRDSASFPRLVLESAVSMTFPRRFS